MELLNKLPSVLGYTKPELLDILQREIYGKIPPKPTVGAEIKARDESFCAGKADLVTLDFTVKASFGEYTFPVYYVCPKVARKVPAFVHINFRDSIPDRYQPTEELVDMGYAVLTFCYKDVTSDDVDFSNGLAGVIYKDGKQTPDGCGKIGMWAWCACAVLDYAMTLEELDQTRISVIGHSRLGKTALLAGALDERFYCAFSNDSGCGGASVARENTGESIEAITRVFPFWFCEKYRTYANNEENMPFDQHFLLAANYPHRVYVASALLDSWACPKNEYISCIAAGEYYKAMGQSGFIAPNRLPDAGEYFHDGTVGYHIRKGKHYLSREDWALYVKYLEK